MLEAYLTALGRRVLRNWTHVGLVVASVSLVSFDTQLPLLSERVSNHLVHALYRGDYQGADLHDLHAFYQRRRFLPAWFNDRGATLDGHLLIEMLRRSQDEGIDAGQFQVDRLEILLREENPARIAQADRLFTTVYLTYAKQLFQGSVDPRAIYPDWYLDRPHMDLLRVLNKALLSGRLQADTLALVPDHAQYGRLRTALQRYQRIAESGGWPQIPPGEVLKLGSSGRRVVLLRQRLVVDGELSRTQNGGRDDLYDETVVEAVKRYQGRHGMRPDGIAADRTLDSLNVPVDQRIRQLLMNMERWRWLPRNFENDHILVNAAGFELEVVSDSRRVMQMHVIVGKRSLPTPVFSGTIRYLVFNPSWEVPRDIIVKELLPRQREDQDFLANHDYRLYSGWGDGAREVDPTEVDWQVMADENFPYRLIKAPGHDNPLGQLKFMFPNPYNVYMHDTPYRNAFYNEARDMSHGCIRLQQPMRLAQYLLRNDSAWDVNRIKATIDYGESHRLDLPVPMPVYILYFTTWVADNGAVHFYEDIYGRDTDLYGRLRREQSGEVIRGMTDEGLAD